MNVFFILCLVSPVIFSVIRKILPDQPNILEPMGIALVMVVGIYALFKRPRIPKFLAIPLITWAVYQGFYAFLSVFYDYRIGAAGFFVNVLPMLMVVIAYQGTRSILELQRIANIFGVLGVLLLPLGFYVAIWGNVNLHPLFLPNAEMIEVGKATRAGIPAFAGIFSTQDVLSMAFMAAYFLNLAVFMGKDTGERGKAIYLIFTLVAFVLVLLSTRRGGVVGVVFGSLFILITGRISWQRKLIFMTTGCMALLVLVFLDSYYGVVYREATDRVYHALNLDFWARFKIVFWDLYVEWIERAPFGTYLGNAGSEGIVFRSDITLRRLLVETGGAKLVAEMGVLGALLMPLMLIYIHLKIFFMRTTPPIHTIVRVLFAYNFVFYVLYYFKEWTAMSGGYFSQLLFWAIPGMCYALIEREQKSRMMRPMPIPMMHINEPNDGMPYGSLPPHYGPPPPGRPSVNPVPRGFRGQSYPR
jgi:hypothetical protein